MAEFFASIFAGTVIAISIQTPRWMMTEIKQSQATFDQFFIKDNACRSDVNHIQTVAFRFHRGQQSICPLRRMDFGAPDSKGQWPHAICTLLEAADHPYAEGTSQCAYR